MWLMWFDTQRRRFENVIEINVATSQKRIINNVYFQKQWVNLVMIISIL